MFCVTVCSSLDIRNTVQSFSQLNDCRVIEGFLQIVLMDRTNESDFVNLSFPKLREITGYLLLYRVNGLTTLANLFPNLSVIRGHDLFMNYALVVYEMLHLQVIMGFANLLFQTLKELLQDFRLYLLQLILN